MSKFNPYNHFGFLTHRVARLIDISASSGLLKSGYNIPSSCIGILADLWQKDGVNQKQLGSSLIKNKSSITKMLSTLEAAELIEKKNDPDDRRNKLIFLTVKGKALRNMIESKGEEMQSLLLAEIPSEEIEISKKVLKAFYINLSKKLFNKNIDE